MADLIFKEETFKIIGAAIEVHKELGFGFLEAVYQEAFERELNSQSIPFLSHPNMSIFYKGEKLTKYYIPDLLCYSQVIVELKAVDQLSGNEDAQLLNYLKTTKIKLGLLINFGSKSKLEWKRLVF